MITAFDAVSVSKAFSPERLIAPTWIVLNIPLRNHPQRI
jgi:hypothetical protein